MLGPRGGDGVELRLAGRGRRTSRLGGHLRIEPTLTSAGPQPSVNFRSDDPAVAAPFSEPRNGATFFLGTSSASGQCRLEISFLPSRWSPINGNGAQHGYTYLESGARGLLTATYALGRIRCWRVARWRAATTRSRNRRRSAWSCASRRAQLRRARRQRRTNLPALFAANNAPAPERCSDADATVANLNILHGHACDPPTPADGDQCRVVERIELLLDHIVAAGCPDVVTMQEHVVKAFLTAGTDDPLPLPIPVPVTKGPLDNTVQLIRDRLPDLESSCGFLYDVVFDPENPDPESQPEPRRRRGDDPRRATPRWRRRSRPVHARRAVLRAPRAVRADRSPARPARCLHHHLSSSSDNGGDCAGCSFELLPGVPSPACPAECDPSKSARVCQAVQLAQLVASTHDVPQPAIVTGDFNSPTNAPPEDATLAELTGLGWIDTYSRRQPGVEPGHRHRLHLGA